MRRKFSALVCALVLLLQLAAPAARAAENVYFPAVNETLLEVTDATMPFWSGGYLYVPFSVFTTQELGLSASYNPYKQKAVIWRSGNPDKALIFTLSSDMVWDAEGNNYSPTAKVRSGTLFIPISVIAAFFSLTYTTAKVAHGYLIRLRSSSSVLSDAAFIDAGAGMLALRYSQYLASRSDSGGSSAPETPGSTGGTQEGTQVCLCIRLPDSAETTEELLDVLRIDGAYVTFYLTEGQIRADGDLLRRITAAGHAVGLIADGKSEHTLTDQLRSANEALWTVTGGKTRLCLLENVPDSSAAVQAGYCPLTPDLSRTGTGLSSLSGASTLLSAVKRYGTRPVSVWLDSAVSVRGLRSFLSGVQKSGGHLSGMTETA